MALDEIRKNKIGKVAKMRKLGIDPYPAETNREFSVSEVLKKFDELAESKKEITLAGRVLARREHGGSLFFDINDGSKIQGYAKEDMLGKENFATFGEFVDVGDFIEIKGLLFKTKKEEKTVEVKKWKMLTKSLLPLPEKWHGLQDVEERFRKRYLDLIFNEDVKQKFLARFKIIGLVREFFRNHNFIEVETPILQTIPGGAVARPFKTHMNDLNMDLYLRVAPELYLKRLLVGGFERVFEIAKNFRNEGMDREHNPEFDMLEAYAAYWTYQDMMNMVEDFMDFLVKNLSQKNEIEHQGKKINFQRPYKRIEFNVVIKEYSGLDCGNDSEDKFKKKASELGIIIEKTMTKSNIADEIFKKVARPKITDPVFIINHPVELSPLSKKLSSNPNHVARFQFLVGGFELMNAFSELNDPQDQRERFEDQKKMREKGNEETHPFDEEFVEALEYGMPPAAGIGIGIDRLVALLTNSHSLREILLFPLMKLRE